MIENAGQASAPWLRHYQSIGNGLARVDVNALQVVVPDHPFWEKFARGWEPDTERVYRSLVGPGSTVVDIGAWIGPTILYALACGAEKVVAVEPNPQSIARLEKMVALNPNVMTGVSLIDRAISSQSGSISMGLAPGEGDTSMFGIGGDELKVQTMTLSTLIADYELDDIDLIKIDVEGAEVFLLEELSNLSHNKGLAVHLSIHVPFFPDHTDKTRFADALRHFTIQDDRGEVLSHDALNHRLQSPESHPGWGTQHGNFFELVLMAE